MPIAPSDIRAQQFRVVFRGYDIEEVDTFLDWIEEQLTRLPGSPSQGTGAAGAAGPDDAPGPDATATAELRGGSPRALRTLHLAERMADQMIADATAEATEIRARARAEAQTVLREARTEAAAVVAAAHRRPPAEIDGMVVRVQRLLAELDRLGDEERRCREGLRTWLDEHDGTRDRRHPLVVPNVAVRRVDTTAPLAAVP
ncbi:MAG TPA: DivIVA domain-containing protein [Geodermatophilus sp.]|nr:DivIVA domain-containing protein [Geodermatophilus sp.]